MASTFQQIATEIQDNNYVTLIILTAVGYDYLLTLSDEVEYIWDKPWTSVSLLFFLIRYFGLCWVIISSICMYVRNLSPLELTPPDLSWKYFSTWTYKCSALIVLSRWAQFLFIPAADLVMVFRVWALWNRSKIILYTLLLPYAVGSLTLLATAFAFSISYHSYGVVVPVLNYSLCEQLPVSIVYAQVADFAQLVLGALMFLFISIQFIRESVQSYKVAKRFQLNNYRSLLMRESVFYFLVVVTYALNNSLAVFNVLTAVWWAMVEFVPICALVPRFTISLRKLYAWELQQGRETTIDTAFGFGYDQVAGTSAIVFAETQLEQNSVPQWGDEEVAVQEGNVGAAIGVA